MKFKYGDHVSFLNDTGGGVVNRVDDKGIVYVLTEDGFEIPVQDKELIFSRNFSYSRDNEVPEKKPEIRKTEEAKPKKDKAAPEINLPANISPDVIINIMLGFVPDKPGPVFNSDIACYLINDSPYYLFYLTGKKESGSMYYLASGHIEPDTKAYIKTFDHTDLSKMSDIHLQVMFLSKGRYIKTEPLDMLINLNLVNFSKESYFRENDYFNEKAVIFNLLGKGKPYISDHITVTEEIKEIKISADTVPGKVKKKEPAPDTLEVDLHFDGESQLAPAAILALQMSRFHSAIEEAISKKLRRLVIIHGLGQGTLKMQIRKELQEKYPGFIYQDASFKEYGFGATMVHLIIDKKQ